MLVETLSHVRARSSIQQCTISRSSAEAEYRGMAQIERQLIWLKQLLLELGLMCNLQ